MRGAASGRGFGLDGAAASVFNRRVARSPAASDPARPVTAPSAPPPSAAPSTERPPADATPTSTEGVPPEVPVEARSTPIPEDAAAEPDGADRRVAIATFASAEQARRVADRLRASGVADDRLHELLSPADRREFLTRWAHTPGPSLHSQAAVGLTIFGCIGAAVASVFALSFFNEAPGMEWLVVVAGTAGIVGAAAGGFLGAFAFAPADDGTLTVLHDETEDVPTLAVEAAATDPNLTASAKELARGGGRCLVLKPKPAAALKPGDTRATKPAMA